VPPSLAPSLALPSVAVPSLAIPSFTSDKELEAALPSTYKGVALRKISFVGSDLFRQSTPQTQQLTAVLASLGKTPADLSFAIASDPTGKLAVGFAAYRVKGVDASRWLPAFESVASAQEPGTTVTQLTADGKTVTRITNPKTTNASYVWPQGDVLFVVFTAVPSLVDDAVAAMP
jgi:hypothetical protein